MSITYRDAVASDAEGMARVQAEIFAARGTGPHGDVAWTRARYIDGAEQLACTVAERAGQILGFQSLKAALPGNPYDVPEGWGIIGTHIAPAGARQGIGRAFFDRSLAAARAAQLIAIDATIGADNPGALAYYEAMGFRSYATTESAIRKRFDLISS